MKNLATPKQVAQAINVSESSIKRWCDRGLLATLRTAGGHRRLAVAEVFQFLRQSGHPLVRPELIGLPSNTGRGATVVGRAVEQLLEALISGDEDQCRRIVFDLYLSGQSVLSICDGVLSPAFHALGLKWESEEIAVYHERRACEIGLRVLHELCLAMVHPESKLGLAVGGTLSGDPYQLPTTMIEVVLREVGWRASSLGTQLPDATIAQAVRDIRPRILWLSVSSIGSRSEFLRQYANVYEVASECDTAVVVGGRALGSELRKEMSYSHYSDNLRHLVTYVGSLTSQRLK